MKINLEHLVSMTEANQNFSRVAKQVDEIGSIVILKNNHPRYVLVSYDALQERVDNPDKKQHKGNDEVMEKLVGQFKEDK